jgi:hypothetical protein
MKIEDRLDKHISDCDAKMQRMDDRIDKLIDSQERCIVALENLAKDTHGVVELYKNAQGAVSLGIGIQRLALWFSKWPIIGIGIYTIYNWLMEHLSKLN